MNELRETAIHEAGHAVTAWRLGLGVSSLTIEPGDGYIGLCRFDDLPEDFNPEFAGNRTEDGTASFSKISWFARSPDLWHMRC